MSGAQINIHGRTGIPILLLLALTLVCMLVNAIILILVFMQGPDPSWLAETPTSELSSGLDASAGDLLSSAFSSTVKESGDKFMVREK